jgi:hypothetical protein
MWERTKEGDDHFGWVFPRTEDEVPGAQPDPINGVTSIRALYDLANPDYTGRYTVPVSPAGDYEFSSSFSLEENFGSLVLISII